MKNIPKSVRKELELLKILDEAPYVFLINKIDFCVKLYSHKFNKLNKWEVYSVMERQPELVDYNHLTNDQGNFIREQYLSAKNSILK